MKHIKTPVRVCDSAQINLYDLRDSDGDRIANKLRLELVREMRDTLNERDDLLAQRDALAKACERLAEAYNATDDMVRVTDPESAPVDIADLIDYQGLVEATELAVAALALVQREEEKQS